MPIGRHEHLKSGYPLLLCLGWFFVSAVLLGLWYGNWQVPWFNPIDEPLGTLMLLTLVAITVATLIATILMVWRRLRQQSD